MLTKHLTKQMKREDNKVYPRTSFDITSPCNYDSVQKRLHSWYVFCQDEVDRYRNVYGLCVLIIERYDHHTIIIYYR